MASLLERPGQRQSLEDHGDGSACAERVGTTRILVGEDQLPGRSRPRIGVPSMRGTENIVELADISDSFVPQEVT